MATVSVRYIVDDVEAAIAFYTERLGFGVEFNPPGFAVLSRGELRLLLNEPGAAESIYLDILAIDPNNQEALKNIILAMGSLLAGLAGCAGSAAGAEMADGKAVSMSSWAATVATSCLTSPPSSLISPSVD